MKRVQRLVMYLLVVLLLMYANKGLCQSETKTKSFLLQAGVNQLMCKDYFRSPFIYRGINWQTRAVFEKENRNVLHISGTYGRGAFQSLVSVKALNQLVSLNAGYFHLLGIKTGTNHQFRFHLGGLVKGFGLLADYSPDLEQSSTQATVSNAINLAGRISYTFRDTHRFIWNLQSPLAAIVYRPDYPFYGKDRAGWTWPGRSMMVSTSLDYQYKLGENWQITGTYHYDFFQYKQPRPIYLLTHNLSFGLKKYF